MAMASQGEQPDSHHEPQRPLCHEHCKPQVSVDHVQVVGVPPAVSSGLALIVTYSDQNLSRARYTEPDLARANGPPCSIRFCVYRN